MNRVFDILKKYMIFIAVLIGISIVLGMSYSNFIVASENHKVAEMYVGTLKYSIEIDNNYTNILTINGNETQTIELKVISDVSIDTYYKLVYENNSNVDIKYIKSSSDSYSTTSELINKNDSKIIKLKIKNNNTTSQTITFKVIGGFATNTLDDVTVPNTYSIIEKQSFNYCTTTETLTQGLIYTNGQYTYSYKQEGNSSSSGLAWKNITTDGWGVQLTDKTSTDAVTSELCLTINDKPVVSMTYMFNASQGTSIDTSSFDTSNVTNMSWMFANTQATELDLSNFNTSKVTNMSGMFMTSKATSLDLSTFDTSNVTNMGSMFKDSQATTLDVSKLNTSKVTYMYAMFSGSNATTLDVSNFDTSKVTNMSYLFKNSDVTELDISKFNTSKVTGMLEMFKNCKSTTLDVSNFDTSNVTNMSGMFNSIKVTTLDVSKFNTSKVTNMSEMFRSSKVTELDLSSFDTSKVINMSFMFESSKVASLDLSSFDTSNVTNMNYMFSSDTNLKTIYASNYFNTNNVTSGSSMFSYCTNLVGGAGTTFNSSKTDKEYAHIDGGTSNPGYFTDIADKNIPEPNSFTTDSWKTIVKAVKNGNTGKYNVGDTKTIDMGTYGTHTLRIANTSTPSECSTSGFSQTACGFVLEFADIITKHNMNPSGTYDGTNYSMGWNKDGWPVTAMRTLVNNDIYNALPNEIKNAIIDTTVVSGHGPSDTTNFTSTDKLYLLAPGEVWSDWKTSDVSSYDTAKDLTRTLDYYINMGVTTENRSPAIKNNDGSAELWYLRTAYSSRNIAFFIVWNDGRCSTSYASNVLSVSPAFRLG